MKPASVQSRLYSMPPWGNLHSFTLCILPIVWNFQFRTAWNGCQMAVIEKSNVSRMPWMKEKYLMTAQCKIYPDWSTLACILPKSNDYMCTTKSHLFPLTVMALPVAPCSPVIPPSISYMALCSSTGWMNNMGQAHPIRRSIIHCSHFLQEIHFFQEVI